MLLKNFFIILLIIPVIVQSTEKKTGFDIKKSTRISNLLHNSSIGNLSGIQEVLSEGININAKDPFSQNTPLIAAASSGHLNIVKYLVENGASVNAHNKSKDTALIRSIIGNHENTAKFLLNNGAFTNIKGDEGKTALLWAVEKGNINLVKALLERDAKVDISDEWGYTPLSKAKFIRQALPEGKTANIYDEIINLLKKKK